MGKELFILDSEADAAGSGLSEEEHSEADRVAKYLIAHPDFLQKREELFSRLKLPGEGENAYSISEHQVWSLREQLSELEKRAAANEVLFRGSRALLLDLVEASAPAEILDLLQVGMLGHFPIEAFSLTLVGEPIPALGAEERFRERAECEAQAPAFAALKSFFCNALRPGEARFLFGSDSVVGSAAVVKLDLQGRDAFFCVGSKDPMHYHPGMGDMFIDFVARSVRGLLVWALRKEAQGRHLGAA